MIAGDLELTVVARADENRGEIVGIAVSPAGDRIVAVGGRMVLASASGRTWEPLPVPGTCPLRDVVVTAETVWVCGEGGELAMSRDAGATWTAVVTGTEVTLHALAVAADGAVWAVGDEGVVLRVLASPNEAIAARMPIATTVRLVAATTVRDEIVFLGADGRLRRWRQGQVREISTGAQRPLTALAVSKLGTWIVTGRGGFVARSPDGVWFSRVKCDVEADLEDLTALADGRLVIVGDRGHVLVSSDDGRTWHAARAAAPVSGGSIGAMHLRAIERVGDGALIGGAHGVVARLGAHVAAPLPRDRAFAAGPVGFLARDADAFDDAFSVVTAVGDAEAFHATYGVQLPDEAAALLAGRAAGARLDDDRNLFEGVVLRSQRAYLGTDLVDAFCGVFAIGMLPDGDSLHMEIYEWDGPRQILHFDHDSHAFSGVLADSLDSATYLAALVKAAAAGTISDDVYRRGIQQLRGKVAPTRHFAVDLDPELTGYDPKRRDTELFFYRSRWICALLQNDGITQIADVRELFMADFNQAIPPEQLPARFEACERFIPTALYSMWRAYLFDEPELEHYLEIARRHAARLVRDAAGLIDELREGRNELGTITDVRAWLAAFRALDLDPRRADARRAEAEERARLDASRRVEALAELDRTPHAQWRELAWRWLEDGVAHRALLQRLDRPDAGDAPLHLAAIDELRDLSDDERAAAIPHVAAALPSELEAILVGSLVRDDSLVGVLAKAPERAPGADRAAPHDEPASPGWDAIDDALEAVYHGEEPHHYGTAVPTMLGGNDPLHGISVYARTEPVPHWHFVTYGFTDLFTKDTDDPDESGFGFELTFRLARTDDDPEPPSWALNFLQNLGRYVFGTGNRFGAGHKMGLNGAIALGQDTQITAICFADDPELGEIHSPFGTARFVQVVGITDDEYRLVQEWSTTGLLDILSSRLPVLVTDLDRPSVLVDPATVAEVEARVTAEGSSEDLSFAGELSLEADEEHVRIEMGALYAAALPRAMRGRIRHGRSYELRGRETTLHLEPASTPGYRIDDAGLVLEVSRELAVEIDAKLKSGLAATYTFRAWPALQIVVAPSFIRAQDGKAIEIRGVLDPGRALRMIAEENARLAIEDGDEDDELLDAALGEDADVSGADDDDDDDDVDGDGEPPAPRDATRVMAALSLTERALRLSPDDTDVQFTHAMLLIDAERAQLPGKLGELLAWLPRFAPAVKVNVAVRMAEQGHARFAEVLELALASPAAFEGVAHELVTELGDAILERAPQVFPRLVPIAPDDITVLADLAWRASEADQRDAASALYDRILAMPVPDDADERVAYLRALNTACVQAHAAKAYGAAVRIAERAQPIAHENPYIFHAAACAYAAVGDYAKALEQVKLAIEHEYDHVHKVEVDSDLGPLLEWPEFKALFRDWHARQEGN